MHDKRRVERYKKAHNENKETARNGEEGFSTNAYFLSFPRSVGTRHRDDILKTNRVRRWNLH